MKKNSIQCIILFPSFLIIIFGFFIFHFLTPDLKQSVLENRKLSQRPDFTVERFLSGEYSQRFDSYYSDQIPLRNKIIEANARVNRKIFLQKVLDDIYLSDDGYLLAQVIEQTEKDAQVVANRINTFAKDMKELNVNVYTAVVPNKSTMMEKKFPDYFPSFGQKNLDMLLSKLDDISNPIDIRDELNSHMNEENMFFYTDHHWQAKAAFYAYQKIMNYIIDAENLDDEVYQYSDYEWSLKGKPFYGSDARKTTAVNVEKTDRILVSTLKGDYIPFEAKWGVRSREGFYETSFFDAEAEYTNRYQAYMGGDYATITVHNYNKPDGKNVLIIKDSYANAIIQFFAPHYSETHVMDLRHYKGISIKEYVNVHEIDHIIILNNVNSIYITPALTDFYNPGRGDNQ